MYSKWPGQSILQFQAGFKTSTLSDGHVLKQGEKLMHSTFQLLSLAISSMLRQHVNITLLPDLIQFAAPYRRRFRGIRLKEGGRLGGRGGGGGGRQLPSTGQYHHT